MKAAAQKCHCYMKMQINQEKWNMQSQSITSDEYQEITSGYNMQKTMPNYNSKVNIQKNCNTHFWDVCSVRGLCSTA